MINGPPTEPPIGGVRGRLASEYMVVSFVESLPVSGSRRFILIPPQKLPQLSQTLRLSSTKRFGSRAFQSSFSCSERSTIPSSTHLYLGLWGSSVRLVANPMAEFLLPNVETA